MQSFERKQKKKRKSWFGFSIVDWFGCFVVGGGVPSFQLFTLKARYNPNVTKSLLLREGVTVPISTTLAMLIFSMMMTFDSIVTIGWLVPVVMELDIIVAMSLVLHWMHPCGIRPPIQWFPVWLCSNLQFPTRDSPRSVAIQIDK